MFNKNFIIQKVSSHKRKIISNNSLEFVPSAVLVPLIYRGGEYYLIFTKRTSDVEHHKKQISFPGGRVDKNDGSLSATALRECNEEVGLLAENIEIVGILDDLLIPSGYLITPIVAFIKEQKFVLNETEVESVLEVKLDEFFNPEKFRVEKWERNGKLVDVYFYDVYMEPIWGATANIIYNFCKILLSRA